MKLKLPSPTVSNNDLMPLAIFNNFKTRAIRKTLITRIIVGLIGNSKASNSSKIMPAIDKITINISNWFHLKICGNFKIKVFLYRSRKNRFKPNAYNFVAASNYKLLVKAIYL